MTKNKSWAEYEKRRRSQILKTALEITKEIGFLRLTRNKIADRIGVNGAAINYYFSMHEIREYVIKQQNSWY